jgi:hypothetical protein
MLRCARHDSSSAGQARRKDRGTHEMLRYTQHDSGVLLPCHRIAIASANLLLYGPLRRHETSDVQADYACGTIGSTTYEGCSLSCKIV